MAFIFYFNNKKIKLRETNIFTPRNREIKINNILLKEKGNVKTINCI